MNVYTSDKIRNVAILGHGGAGKTSLVEAMAYLSGITSRLGNVTDGTTISDYDKEEQKRKFSISTAMVPVVWGDTKVNVLDTPGYFDFVGDFQQPDQPIQPIPFCRQQLPLPVKQLLFVISVFLEKFFDFVQAKIQFPEKQNLLQTLQILFPIQTIPGTFSSFGLQKPDFVVVLECSNTDARKFGYFSDHSHILL